MGPGDVLGGVGREGSGVDTRGHGHVRPQPTGVERSHQRLDPTIQRVGGCWCDGLGGDWREQARRDRKQRDDDDEPQVAGSGAGAPVTGFPLAGLEAVPGLAIVYSGSAAQWGSSSMDPPNS